MAINLDYAPGATPLDPDEAAGLIPSHITTQGQLNEWEAQNIIAGEQWARNHTPATKRGAKKYVTVIDEKFMRDLHKSMFNKTWKWAGQFRLTEKNIGVAPHHITSRLRDLAEDVKLQLTASSMPLNEIAARFHHRLVAIHLFANGNGRHARLMTDLLLVERGGPAFTWGGRNLVQASAVRARSIDALRAADRRDMGPLLKFVMAGNS